MGGPQMPSGLFLGSVLVPNLDAIQEGSIEVNVSTVMHRIFGTIKELDVDSACIQLPSFVLGQGDSNVDTLFM